MPYYGFDIYYLIYVVPALLFTLWAQIKVKSTFSKYSKVASERGLTGADAARAILRRSGINVAVATTRGSLTDHFDPRNNTVYLSESTHSVASVAAVGVAAHECGHAIQYAEGYGPMKLRQAIIPATNIGSKLAVPLIIIGLILGFAQLSWLGIIFFSLSVLFQLVTLPVEFNASRRALRILEDSGMLSDEGLKSSKKVLTAAAMTYVAALFTALASLLRFVALVNNGNRRR